MTAKGHCEPFDPQQVLYATISMWIPHIGNPSLTSPYWAGGRAGLMTGTREVGSAETNTRGFWGPGGPPSIKMIPGDIGRG